MSTRNRAENHLKQFLSRHHTSGQPLLAGVSGGADSLALLYALEQLGVDAHVAHLDHGWRAESGAQAEALRKMCSLPFHMRQIVCPQDENSARDARHLFFRELCEELGCEAVLLAHHADDRAETVFKRAVEGAPLVHLSGPRPVQEVAGLTLWRPFLGLTKDELYSPWEPLEDRTNSDPTYHRAKLRTQVFPLLQRPVGRNLARLGAEADALGDYLDGRVAPLLSRIQRGPFGLWLDLSHETLHEVELRHLVRRVSSGLSREQLDTVVDVWGRPNRRVGPLFLDRGHLFVPEAVGQWHVKEVEGGVSDGWSALWQEGAVMEVPAGPWTLTSPSRAMRKRYNSAQVPAFLRDQLPVVRASDGREYSWLLRKASSPPSGASLRLFIGDS